MKKLIPVFVVMLLLITSVAAFTDYTHEKKQCKQNGGTWIFDDFGSVPSPVDYGHCEYPAPAVSRRNRNSYKLSCDFDKVDRCNLFAYHFKAMPLVIDGKDYTLTYNGKNFLGPIVRINNAEGRWVYWGPLFKGKLSLVRPNFDTGITVTSINSNMVEARISFTNSIGA